MGFACWITKGKNTQSGSVTLIDFQQQQCLLERTSIFRYTYIVYLAVVLIEN